jgi:hypothetical protein
MKGIEITRARQSLCCPWRAVQNLGKEKDHARVSRVDKALRHLLRHLLAEIFKGVHLSSPYALRYSKGRGCGGSVPSRRE